ncbi:MAG: hypothetical protein WA118_06710 [Carboxydocellales bacterium]
MNDNLVKDPKEYLEKTSPDVQLLIKKVIDVEHAKLHMKNATGVKDEIIQIVREVIR